MALKDHEFGDGFLGKTSVIPGTGVPRADRMSVSGLAIEVGDIVLLDENARRVCACAADNGHHLALVETFEHVVILSAHFDR